MSIEKFRGVHSGETMLLVGNGSNLLLTPPEKFNYPSIGVNTIHLYDGWKPDYYIAVDRRVENEFGAAILEKYSNIPKLVPERLARWQGKEFYTWRHEPGPLWSVGHKPLFQKDIGDKSLISYGNVMHVAMKIAYFMRAKTILIIGMEHEPGKMTRHFWTEADEGMGMSAPLQDWLEGYRQLCEGFAAQGIRMLNISENTFVPEKIIPQDDWKNWIGKSRKNKKHKEY